MSWGVRKRRSSISAAHAKKIAKAKAKRAKKYDKFNKKRKRAYLSDTASFWRG
jgi:hypothetical protein